ncbi:hypothetical protein EIN_475940 [Entamoeba invadens IP1]|uniref:GINS subunit domain-containing protein n=1 Tax=Entamoeba invadens IP1 TaxID=370355 RepID=A0A0A1U7A2_ENTIV|nr:hypothetical protein EIN_475940 [Entamoeba invadens IP1]ELP88892.1 hypothetical protein EIN_475940 [Entamoeba invadens IP1]|eukprot:XP_004255663.1 hypothetical protein EIN_475940 [Entamoeba invadens IP1]
MDGQFLSVLSEEMIIQVQAIEQIQGLGFLDKSKSNTIPSLAIITQTQRSVESGQPEKDDDAIPQGRTFEVPLWLARTLQRNGYVRIVVDSSNNKQYSRQFIKATGDFLKNQPTKSTLSKFPFYFEAGIAIAKEIGDVAMVEELGKLMLDRIKLLYDRAFHINEESTQFVKTLTFHEKELYQTIVEENAEALKVKTARRDVVGKSVFSDQKTTK